MDENFFASTSKVGINVFTGGEVSEANPDIITQVREAAQEMYVQL
jgi:hypothetical protein